MEVGHIKYMYSDVNDSFTESENHVMALSSVCFDHGYIKVLNTHESKSTNIKVWRVIQEALDLGIKSTSVTRSCI